MGLKVRLSSNCTKRANNGVDLVTSHKITTRLARPIMLQPIQIDVNSTFLSLSCKMKGYNCGFSVSLLLAAGLE